MRALGWIAAGLVVGFMLGGLPAERERDALQRTVTALQRELRAAKRPDVLGSFLPRLGDRRVGAGTTDPTRSAGERAGQPGEVAAAPAVDGGLPGTEPTRRPEPSGDVAVIGGDDDREPQARSREPREVGSQAQPALAGRDARPDADAPTAERGRGDGRSRRSLLERFDQLARVQRARAAASRQALIEQAGLDQAQVARVDATMTRMNDQLTGYGEEMIDQFVRDEPPTPAQALGLGHDVSGIMFEGQKELDAIVGEAADAVDPSAMEVWNYVDVERWRPVLEEHRPALERAAAEAEAARGAAGSGAAGQGEDGDE
jgi:hypothetical protein